MKLLEKYFKKINFTNKDIEGGFLWMNPQVKNVPFKNVKMIQFNSLYANIIAGLVDCGTHLSERDSVKLSLDNFKNEFENFNLNRNDLKEHDSEKYKEILTSINSFYGSLGFLSKTEMSLNYPGFVVQYLKYFYEDLLKNNKNILYIDTDRIYFIDEIDLLNFNIDYTIEEFDYVLFSEEKRYITFKDGKYKSMGYSSKNSNKLAKLEKQSIDMLKTYIRENKIEILGI